MGRPVKDLTGQVFGLLTVIERDTSKPSGAGKSAYWICQCECGGSKSVRQDKLTNHTTQSCGCLQDIARRNTVKDLVGWQSGFLTVLKRDTSKPTGKNCSAYWICQCTCGNIVSVRGNHLTNYDTQSCGCINSQGELAVRKCLDNNIAYKQQYSFKDLKGDYKSLRFDFGLFKNNNLIGLIEYQGKQHYEPWGNETEERFNKRLEYDNKKRNYCLTHSIPLLEIKYDEPNKINWEYIKSFFSIKEDEI